MSSLGIYPYDFSANFKDSFHGTILDTDGIPLQYMRGLGYRYYWITISRYALAQHALFLKTQKEEHRDIFLNVAHWLADRAKEGPHGAMVWYHELRVPFYKIDYLWLSGMAQSRNISVFLRVWQITHEERFLEFARRSFITFSHSVSEGGVAARFPDRTLGFEEWGTRTPSLSLNGFMATIIGVDEFVRAAKDELAARLLDEALEGLQNNLQLYDTGYWTRYDLWKPMRLASPNYHQVHLDWLAIFAKRWPNQLYEAFAKQWREYQIQPWSKMRWLIHKVYEKATYSPMSFHDLSEDDRKAQT